MDLRTKLATAFTVTIAIAVVGWSAANPLTQSFARSLLDRGDRARSSIATALDSTSAARERERIERGTECRVSLDLDSKLAGHPAPNGDFGSQNEGELRLASMFTQPNEQVTCTARIDDEGACVLSMTLSNASNSKWFKVKIPHGSCEVELITAEYAFHSISQQSRGKQDHRIATRSFAVITGTLVLHHLPLVPGERVPFDLDLRVDPYGGGFHWYDVVGMGDVLVER